MRPPRTRAEVIDQLVEVGRSAVNHARSRWPAVGNLSARLPGEPEFVVTAAGNLARPADPPMTSACSPSAGSSSAAPSNRRRSGSCTSGPTSARPDVNAVVHLHPQHAVLVDALGHLDPAVQPSTTRSYVRSVGTVPLLPERLRRAGRRRRRAGGEGARLHRAVPPRLLGPRRGHRHGLPPGPQPGGGGGRQPSARSCSATRRPRSPPASPSTPTASATRSTPRGRGVIGTPVSGEGVADRRHIALGSE